MKSLADESNAECEGAGGVRSALLRLAPLVDAGSYSRGWETPGEVMVWSGLEGRGIPFEMS